MAAANHTRDTRLAAIVLDALVAARKVQDRPSVIRFVGA